MTPPGASKGQRIARMIVCDDGVGFKFQSAPCHANYARVKVDGPTPMWVRKGDKPTAFRCSFRTITRGAMGGVWP